MSVSAVFSSCSVSCSEWLLSPTSCAPDTTATGTHRLVTRTPVFLRPVSSGDKSNICCGHSDTPATSSISLHHVHHARLLGRRFLQLQGKPLIIALNVLLNHSHVLQSTVCSSSRETPVLINNFLRESKIFLKHEVKYFPIQNNYSKYTFNISNLTARAASVKHIFNSIIL